MAPLVLVVDDDREIRIVIRMNLEPMFRVVEAPDGLAGIKAARELNPALIVTDLGMPGMNGLDLTAQLKADPATCDIPVVILTGATRGEEVSPAVWKQGTTADHFIEKPFDPDELRAVLDRLIKRRFGVKPLPPGKGHYD